MGKEVFVKVIDVNNGVAVLWMLSEDAEKAIDRWRAFLEASRPDKTLFTLDLRGVSDAADREPVWLVIACERIQGFLIEG
jgi:hypothetical protein